MTDALADHLREHDHECWEDDDTVVLLPAVSILRCMPPTRTDFEAWERLREVTR